MTTEANKEIATLTLDWVKQTPGTHVYGSSEEGIAVRTLYILKSALGDGPAPDKIEIMVSRM